MKCRFCDREFKDAGNLKMHEDTCEFNPDKLIFETQCRFCGRKFSNGPKAHLFAICKLHENHCPENPNKVIFTCETCGQKFNTKKRFENHLKKNSCKNADIKFSHYTNCVFCNKEILNFGSLKSHEKYCLMNPNRVERPKFFGIARNTTGTSWNKGLTSENDERVALIAKKNKDTAILKKSLGKVNSGQASTPELETKRREKISKSMKNNPLAGGKRHGSGRGKKGWYKGFFCDSSWELAYVIFNLDNGISFKRNLEGFEYEFEGKIHKFYPDFILDNGTFIEIKGYMNLKNKTKIDMFKNIENLVVIDKNSIKPYIEYAESKFGKDFTKVYENKN